MRMTISPGRCHACSAHTQCVCGMTWLLMHPNCRLLVYPASSRGISGLRQNTRRQVPPDKAGPSVLAWLPGPGRQHNRGWLLLEAHAEAKEACSPWQGSQKEPRGCARAEGPGRDAHGCSSCRELPRAGGGGQKPRGEYTAPERETFSCESCSWRLCFIRRF